MRRVIVVGAGVVGLSSAVRLLEAGHRVDVLARELPFETTSAIAGAIWSPYAEPQEHVVRWAAVTYEVLAGLAGASGTGVALRDGTEVFRGGEPHLWWAEALPTEARPVRETRLPAGWASGLTMRLPVVEMPTYLRWLVARVRDLGGTITRMNLTALPRVQGVLVVNASGIGARHLAGDRSVGPVRGQVVLVEQCGVDRWMVDSSGPTYVIPRRRDVVVGGTAQSGEWSPAPDPVQAADIMARAVRLVPDILGARVLRHRVGLRPQRAQVRLERSGDTIHCYGHGGCGVTVSWGCADDVVALAS